ncbi:YpmS family protein [Halobacillus shinanisalinarum]|uniref:YpmS family protein n=1 Tax=Halobacillus shinanisalinarum TaxID=2932258 RepID=A0ABY4H563_9BACI|nr:YpmS family protein [Halobacillus shinanisalinarum]UOQ95235.1 YpmS family protein [Halobacillus shinanisalinarum]
MLKRWFFKNKWRSSFVLLGAINLGIILWVLSLVFLPTSYQIVNVEPEEESSDAEFTIVSTKQNLEQLANEYLSELSTQTIFDYSISLDRNVTLIGNIKAFEQTIPIKLELKPIVQENGDLILEQERISLGKLPLPNKKVLEYVAENYKFPEWVRVHPNEENIYVAVTQMDTASNFKIAVDRFNLNSNQLAFRISVPNDTFNFAQALVEEKLK